MDFDPSKENIQPLRGGRNVTHLEVALQAQSDSELQRELIQQKESFEEAIRTYEGDDPLENWYNYIYWVEQSYPKHGHEGNLVPLLEDCLSKFENEEKYIHDRRLCKLWIKYIDLQQNPLELFQLLHSKGICVSCADLFRAWAYYHEVSGDHKRADAVFELGISALAQPYEDLVLARNNMYTAIGRQAVTGVDERRLVEQRHALTSLRPFVQRRTTMVPNVRTGSQVLNNAPGVVQQSLLRNDRASNAPITLYEDRAVAGTSVGGAGAAVSILDVARRQEVVHKENALKPGQWNSKKIIGTRVGQHRDPNFIIHVDDDPVPPEGIRLPADFAPMNHDDFSTWQTLLYFPEPDNANQVRMYPKHLVYADEPNTEYSPEEIRARKWFANLQAVAADVPVNASFNIQETMMEEANIVTASSQATVDVQAVPSSSQRESYSVPRPTVVTQQHVQNTSAQFPEQASLQQSVNYQNRQQIETARDSQYHVQNSSQYYSAEPEVRTASQYQIPQSFNAQLDPRHSVQYQNYNSDAQTMRQSSQYYPQANTQAFRQNAHYQQQNYVPEMQNQTLGQQQSSLHNYSLSEARHNYGQNPAVQNYSSTDVQNESSSQYQQPMHNYQAGQNVTLKQSYMSSKNIVSYQNQPNTCAETYVPQSSYAAQPRQSYAAQPSVPIDLDPVTKVNPPSTWSNNTLSAEENYTVNMREAIKDVNDLWKDNPSTMPEPVVEVKKPEIAKFQIHEDTEFLQDDTDARKSVVKSTPFAIFTDDTSTSPVVPRSARKQPLDSATGSSSGTNEILYGSTASAKVVNAIHINGRNSRAPFASQPLPDCDFVLPRKSISHSQPIVVHSVENRKSNAIQNVQDPSTPGGFNDTCTTQMFNFNLNTLQAHSTPFHYKKAAAQQYTNVTLFANDESEGAVRQCVSKKVLFDAREDTKKPGVSFMPQEETCMPEKLSVILETTKEYGSSSSSSSGGTTLKTTTFNFRGSLNVIPESAHQQTNDESTQESKTNNANRSSEDEKSTVNDYNMLKDLLRSGEDNEQQYRPSVGFMDGYNHNERQLYNQQNNQVIDLTEDDSGKARKSHYPMRFSDVGDMSGFNLHTQQQPNQPNDFMKHFESPGKNQFKGFESPGKTMQFYEHSNDSVTRSPAKGSRMDVDAVLHAQNSNSELKMDYDSYQEAPVDYLEDPILQKPPSDPFANKLISALLNKVGFPSGKYAKCYIELQTLPRIGKKDSSKKEMICLGDEKFHVEKVIGKGSFGTVYKAINDSTNAMVALKLQKPANKWEFYICKEIRERLPNPYMLNAFMDVSTCYVSHNASIIVSEFFKLGSLLDLTNKVKQVTGKGVKELVAIYYASEIMAILSALHQCRIIHADIKPDNFLVTRMPPEYGHPSLQLIDFGCSIDMSLFPEGTTFTKVINTENFTCTEMKDGRPWTYQTDMFCLAATVHVLLFEKYMQVQKRGDVWHISQNIPRYMRKDLWNTFFFQMLNIDGCDKLPDLSAIKASFATILSAQSEELQVDMRFVANSIYGR